MAEAMALRWLARREYARAELERKLAARGVPSGVARQTVAQLASRGLQSDARFAQSLTAMRQRRGYGPARVLAELRAGGVDEDAAEAAIGSAQADWVSAARAWCRRHYGEVAATDTAARAQLERALRRRGFTGAQLRALLAPES